MKKAQILIKVSTKGEMSIAVVGKKVDLVKLLSISMLESEQLRELISDATLVLLEAHLAKHGVNLRDLMRQAASETNPYDIATRTKKPTRAD